MFNTWTHFLQEYFAFAHYAVQLEHLGVKFLAQGQLDETCKWRAFIFCLPYPYCIFLRRLKLRLLLLAAWSAALLMSCEASDKCSLS